MYRVIEIETIVDNDGMSVSEQTIHKTSDLEDAKFQAQLRYSVNEFSQNPRNITLCIKNAKGEVINVSKEEETA